MEEIKKKEEEIEHQQQEVQLKYEEEMKIMEA